jgi:hypothetical protein
VRYQLHLERVVANENQLDNLPTRPTSSSEGLALLGKRTTTRPGPPNREGHIVKRPVGFSHAINTFFFRGSASQLQGQSDSLVIVLSTSAKELPP